MIEIKVYVSYVDIVNWLWCVDGYLWLVIEMIEVGCGCFDIV